MNSQTQFPLGVYIHIPFCRQKCPYCDFYSKPGDDKIFDLYTEAVCRSVLHSAAAHGGLRADSLYFGGGTPSLLGARRIAEIIAAVWRGFAPVSPEVTLEVNPGDLEPRFFEGVAEAGVNRISIGLQSANAEELAFLGRRHTLSQAAAAVKEAQKAGITNISLDLMLGLEGQTKTSLARSIDFCAELSAKHLSMYLLKIEPGTRFFHKQEQMLLPDEEVLCELYLFACEYAAQKGFLQYEISNFSQAGFECRHNLKYWNSEDYLGFGPAAHSCFGGGRFYYPRDLEGFLQGQPPQNDGASGGFEEYAMLRLRLNEGLDLSLCAEMFGVDAQKIKQKSRPLEQAGFLLTDNETVRLTPRGFLVSNAIIAKLVLD